MGLSWKLPAGWLALIMAEVAMKAAGRELSPTFLLGYGPCTLNTDTPGKICLIVQ